MNSLHDKIEYKMKQLESMMNDNKHLSNTKETLELIDSINKYSTLLSEDDSEYFGLAKYATFKGLKWE